MGAGDECADGVATGAVTVKGLAEAGTEGWAGALATSGELGAGEGRAGHTGVADVVSVGATAKSAATLKPAPADAASLLQHRRTAASTASPGRAVSPTSSGATCVQPTPTEPSATSTAAAAPTPTLNSTPCTCAASWPGPGLADGGLGATAARGAIAGRVGVEAGLKMESGVDVASRARAVVETVPVVDARSGVETESVDGVEAGVEAAVEAGSGVEVGAGVEAGVEAAEAAAESAAVLPDSPKMAELARMEVVSGRVLQGSAQGSDSAAAPPVAVPAISPAEGACDPSAAGTTVA